MSEIYKVIVEKAESKSENDNNIVKEQIPVAHKMQSNMSDIAFAMPRSGRPKTLEGKYHIFTARLREDLFQYAQSITGKDQEFQSVNDYLNRLIARDMLSRMQK